jgi:hypothetical protein
MGLDAIPNAVKAAATETSSKLLARLVRSRLICLLQPIHLIGIMRLMPRLETKLRLKRMS